MISETSTLLSYLLGSIFTSWLSCEPIRVLIELLVIVIVINFVLKLLRR